MTQEQQEKIYSIPNPISPKNRIGIRVNGNVAAINQIQEQYKRGLEAAEMSRVISDWHGSSSHVNDTIMSALRVIRARSREQSHNSPVGRAYFEIINNNVVGPDGFTLKLFTSDTKGNQNNKNNDIVEAKFKRWTKVCDMSKRNNFTSLLSIIIKAVARDGEALIRKHYFKPTPRNPIGFGLQLLNIDVLDTNYNVAEKDGVRVVMGVELDQFDCVTAYYLTNDESASAYSAKKQKRVRVPAAEIYHVYYQEYPEQWRGLPWMRAAMKTIYELERYEGYARIASQAGAAQMGFIVPNGESSGGAELLADEEEDPGSLISNVEPGVIQVLPKGYTFQKFDPVYPHAMLGEFIKSQRRAIANALTLCYNSLFGDLEGVNYSSIRQNLLAEREMYKALHAWFCNAFLNQVFQDFVREGFKNNAFIDKTGYKVPDFEIDSFMEDFVFRGRSWSWVDPKNDLEAAKIAKDLGIYSPSRIAEMMGEDIWAQMAETARVRDEAKRLDIYIDNINDPAANAQAAAEKEARDIAAQQAATNAQLAQENAKQAQQEQAKALKSIDERLVGEVRALQQQVELSRSVKPGDINVTPTVNIEPAAVNVNIGTSKRTKTNVLRDERGLVIGMETVVTDEETAEKQEEKPAETAEITDIPELEIEIKDEIAQEVEAERALDIAIEAAETQEAADVA